MADERDHLRRAFRSLLGAWPGRPPIADGRARFQALVDAARSRDYFAVLGLPPTCSAADARRVADELLDWVDTFAVQDASLPPADVTDARQVVRDARDVLGDDESLAAYRRGMTSG